MRDENKSRAKPPSRQEKGREMLRRNRFPNRTPVGFSSLGTAGLKR